MPPQNDPLLFVMVEHANHRHPSTVQVEIMKDWDAIASYLCEWHRNGNECGPGVEFLTLDDIRNSYVDDLENPTSEERYLLEIAKSQGGIFFVEDSYTSSGSWVAPDARPSIRAAVENYLATMQLPFWHIFESQRAINDFLEGDDLGIPMRFRWATNEARDAMRAKQGLREEMTN